MIRRLLAFIMLFATLVTSTTAFADEIKPSNVLTDLNKDPKFKASDYVKDTNDTSLHLIQLAESTAGEVLIYVYQPSATPDILASSINISLTEKGQQYHNYTLSYQSSSGVFFKYKVDDLIVSEDPIRYYDVTGIYRPWIDKIDGIQTGATANQIVNELVYDVSQLWTFTTLNNDVIVIKEDIETIKVTDKFVGFVRYPNGFEFIFDRACDSHFVAFSTDKAIDDLLEADVYYQQQNYKYAQSGSVISSSYGDVTDKYAYLIGKDKYYTGQGFYLDTSKKGYHIKYDHYTYYWNEIQTVDEFFASVEGKQDIFTGAVFDVDKVTKITTENKNNLKTKQWVLRFAETSYQNTIYPTGSSKGYDIISNVSILRLKFVTEGVTYNLGVIDNKQTGSRNPINGSTYTIGLTDDFLEFLGYIFGLVAVILTIYSVVDVADKYSIKRNSQNRRKK